MIFEWDEAKRTGNLAKHGVDFNEIWEFDWHTALILPDIRQDYGERREWAIGFIKSRLHVAIFTRRDNAYRIVSVRRANDRERDRYDRDKT